LFQSWRPSVPRVLQRRTHREKYIVVDSGRGGIAGVANFGFAQANETGGDVSFASYDTLKADIGMIGRLSGKPDMAANSGDAENDDPGQGLGCLDNQAAVGRRGHDRTAKWPFPHSGSFPLPI